MSVTGSSPLVSGGLLAAIVVIVVAAAGAGWWRFGQASPESDGATPLPENPQPLTIVVSGDTAGWIVPCGCTTNQSGGLLRRGTFIADERQKRDVLYVDVGGAPSGVSEYERVKFEAILAGELKMGLAAHNLGLPELALGADYLRDVARRLKVPFVSANVRDEAGQPVAEAHRVISIAGRRIAVVGVVTRENASAGFQIGDPREAVVAIADELRGQCDAIVVLAYLAEDELRKLAESLPEVDAVVGGPTGQSMAPTRVRRGLLASATNKGKFLIKLQPPVATETREWNGQVVEVGPDFDDDAAQQANLAQFYGALNKLDLEASNSGFAPQLPSAVPEDYVVAGSASCVDCHREEHTIWAASTHAHAWSSLKKTGAHVDAYCQQCHSTGFGLPGGFVSRRLSPERISVGCESCHGPSQAHARNPKVATPFLAADQCLRCHDRENSPEFDYDDYWPQIEHGRNKSSAQQETKP